MDNVAFFCQHLCIVWTAVMYFRVHFCSLRVDDLAGRLLCHVLQVLSNIVSVRAHQVDKDEKTWHFSNKVF